MSGEYTRALQDLNVKFDNMLKVYLRPKYFYTEDELLSLIDAAWWKAIGAKPSVEIMAEILNKWKKTMEITET